MRVLTDMESLPRLREPVVTVGSFDGVHRGHRFLLDILGERARLAGGESVVVTFGEHPRRVLESDGELRMLTSADEKRQLLAEAGVDNLVVMPFTESTSRLSAEEFVRDFLIARLGVRELVVGYNHRLGHGREGGAEVLRELGAKYGFRVFCAPRFEAEGLGDRGNGEKISSTAIRRALSAGDVATAERMLGRKI
jgi:riboflavin kinase/FMN adenylyltransferase